MDLLHQPLNSVPVAAIDLEMTGLSQADRVCEVAIVRGRGGVVESRFQSLVLPPVPMGDEASEVNGLTDEDLTGAPRFDALADVIQPLLRGAVVVAHNTPFDLDFLEREVLESGRDWEPPVWGDTLSMARRLFAFPRNNLAEVAQRLEVSQQPTHRALEDAEVTFDVFFKMLDVIDPDAQLTLADLNELLDALAPNSPLRLRQRRLLTEAHRKRQTVHITYQSTSDPLEGLVEREVAPWKVKLPRVQGWCYLREGERVFRLDRMRTVRAGERSFEIPRFKARI